MCFHHLWSIRIEIDQLLSNNSLFVGQLYENKSLPLRALNLIFFKTDRELLLNNSLLELVCFLINQLGWNICVCQKLFY